MTKDKFGLNKIVQSSKRPIKSSSNDLQGTECNKSTRCTFVMDTESHRRLKLSSVHTGITMSNILKEAIELYFTKHPERLINE